MVEQHGRCHCDYQQVNGWWYDDADIFHGELCGLQSIWFVLLVVVLDHQSPADLRSDWISGKKVLCDKKCKLSKILNHLVIQVCFS